MCSVTAINDGGLTRPGELVEADEMFVDNMTPEAGCERLSEDTGLDACCMANLASDGVADVTGPQLGCDVVTAADATEFTRPDICCEAIIANDDLSETGDCDRLSDDTEPE